MPTVETDHRGFEVPPEADFFAHCANKLLEIRQGSYRRDLPGYIYDSQTGLYDKEAKEIDELLAVCSGYMSPQEIKLVQRSFFIALVAHADQYRFTHEPYSMHVTAVTLYAVEKQLDARIVSASILHDTVEDTRDKPDIRITQQTIETYIHPDVAQIVQGLTAFRAEYGDASLADEKTRLKIILSLLTDPRVAIIKIFDRLHNMETLQGMKPSKRSEKIIETQQIYIPLAKLLGLTDEAERLDYLCLVHDDKVDKARLNSVTEARAIFLQNFDADNTLKNIQEITGIQDNLHWRISSDAAAYRDPTALHHMNIDIPISSVASTDGANGAESLWNVMRRFIHHTDNFIVEDASLSEVEFKEELQQGLADSLHFWVVRKSDGVRFHMHIYPKDVYDIELTPMTYAYKPGVLSDEDRRLYRLADEKHILLAKRLQMVLREEGGVDMMHSDLLLKMLEPRIGPNEIYVVGEEEVKGKGDVVEKKRKPTRVTRGSTILDYALVQFASSGDWTKIMAVEINGIEGQLLSYVLKPRDIVHIDFADSSQVDPSWIHIFATEQDGPDNVRNKLLRRLKSLGTEESELFAHIRREGLAQCQKMLPAGDPVFRYGLLESDARPLVEEAIVGVKAYMQDNHLQGLLHTLELQADDIQLEKLFYFGVGFGIISKEVVGRIMSLAGDANRSVRVVEIMFAKNKKGQMGAVGRMTEKVGINTLGSNIEKEAGGLRVLLYISREDESKIAGLASAMWANPKMEKLTLTSIRHDF